MPPQLVVPPDAGDTSALEQFLSDRRGSHVEVRAPLRGEKRRLQELATENARLALESEVVQAERKRLRRVEALEELREALNLESLPLRIECYDISNIQGESVVGSMVVFQDAMPKKAHYRKFGVRSLDGQDDFAALAEVVSRRFARLQDGAAAEDYDESFAATPNLVVIDGGKGQLAAALAAMQAYDLPRVAVIALAKREEEVFVPGQSDAIRLDRDSPGLHLLQRVRDEAHRFALGFHRQRRDAKARESIFDTLQGVGPARRRALLRHFGSAERFLAASQEELGGRARDPRANRPFDLRPAAQGRPGVAGAVGPAAALALVRKRTFGPYFLGNALSASGTWFQNLAASLLVYRQTHSALLLGVLNFSQFIPILLLAPWAGGASDRWNRRSLLLVTQSVAVVLSGGLGLLAYLDLAPTGVVIADAVALGVVSAFSAPAQQAMITQLVDEPEVPTAVALNSMTFNLARAIGPASAALAVQYLGIPAAFGLNAVSYLIFIGALLFIGPQRQQLAERTASYLGASIGILRRRPQLVIFLLIVAAVGFASDPVNTLAPAWAHAFGRQDTVAGYIIGVFGAGAVTAGLVVAGRVGGSRRRMFTTLLMLGLGMVAFSITPWLPLALPFLFVAGFGYLASNTHATSRLQLGVEPWERGRIMALWSVAFLGLRPFASIIDGVIANEFGVRYAGVLLALPALACAGWIALRARTRGWGPARAELPPETA